MHSRVTMAAPGCLGNPDFFAREDIFLLQVAHCITTKGIFSAIANIFSAGYGIVRFINDLLFGKIQQVLQVPENSLSCKCCIGGIKYQ
jgi:hypothetical protein